MKKILSLALLFSALFLSAQSKTANYFFPKDKIQNPEDEFVLISITWKKAPGFGSNQCAIWIEDEKGDYVTTLYVSNFSGKGGFIKRPDCLTTWRKKADIGTPSLPTKLDAVTAATPKNGKNSIRWDMTDSQGNRVPAGIYQYCIETNLYFSEKALWKGEIDTAQPNIVSNAHPAYFPKDSNKKNRTVLRAEAIYHKGSR